MKVQALYDRLAGLLAYPGPDYRRRVALCAESLETLEPAAVPLLNAFLQRTAGSSPEDLQELFTRAFDLNPVCSLEIGWHLYGENYERGALLVRMREELRRHRVAESTELPDHLAHVLPLLARMPAAEAERFAAGSVLPALDKMRTAWNDTENPFGRILEALALVLESRYPRPAQTAAATGAALRVLND
jgi:nitrate reductase molybdenum cofactor assembly chaperone